MTTKHINLTNVAEIANSDEAGNIVVALRNYRHILDQLCPVFTVAEWLMICDVISTYEDVHSADINNNGVIGVMPLDIKRGLRGEILENAETLTDKWKTDADVLIAKLHNTLTRKSSAQQCAIKEVATKFLQNKDSYKWDISAKIALLHAGAALPDRGFNCEEKLRMNEVGLSIHHYAPCIIGS